MGGIGPREILILLVIALLLFGAKKLPELARSMGRSARILKAEAKGLNEEENSAPEQPAQQNQAQAQQPATPQAYDAQNNQAYGQPAQPTPPSYPQLPPGQRIVDGSSTESVQQRPYGS